MSPAWRKLTTIQHPNLKMNIACTLQKPKRLPGRSLLIRSHHLAFRHSPHEIRPLLADVTSSHATWSAISLVTLLVISCNTSFTSTSCCALRNVLQTFFSPFLWWQAWVGKKGVVTSIASKFHTSPLTTISSTLNLMKILYFLMN
jgi:hypothetical protein